MPAFCPECGGELVWDRKLRAHSCRSCGVTFTESQLSEARDRLYSRPRDEEEQRRNRHSDYLDWWTSNTKKKD